MTHQQQQNIMEILQEPILNDVFRYKHNMEYVNSMNHVKMFKQHYDDIPRYIKEVYGDRFPQIEINIPIK